MLKTNTFPWATRVEERKNVMSGDLVAAILVSKILLNNFTISDRKESAAGKQPPILFLK